MLQISNAIKKSLKICTNIDTCLTNLDVISDTSVAVSQLHAQHCPSIDFSHIYCFNEENYISGVYNSFIFNDSFLLSSQLNQNIKYIFETGLIQKWAQDARTYWNRKHEIFETVSLSIEHFTGPWFILSIGLFLACLSLIGEWFTHNQLKKNGSNKFWECMEKIVCIPERLYYIRDHEAPPDFEYIE